MDDEKATGDETTGSVDFIVTGCKALDRRCGDGEGETSVGGGGPVPPAGWLLLLVLLLIGLAAVVRVGRPAALGMCCGCGEMVGEDGGGSDPV